MVSAAILTGSRATRFGGRDKGALLEPLARRLAARTLKMIALFDDVRVCVVEADSIERFGDRHRLLANVNTPADYAALEALHGHER